MKRTMLIVSTCILFSLIGVPVLSYSMAEADQAVFYATVTDVSGMADGGVFYVDTEGVKNVVVDGETVVTQYIGIADCHAPNQCIQVGSVVKITATKITGPDGNVVIHADEVIVGIYPSPEPPTPPEEEPVEGDPQPLEEDEEP